MSDEEALFETAVEAMESGDLAAAEEFFAQAEAGFLDRGEVVSSAIASQNRASVLEDMGRFDEAIEVIEDALERAGPSLNASLLAEMRLMNGLLREHVGDAQRSIDLCSAALEGFKLVGDEEPAVLAAVNLAGVLAAIGRRDEALAQYQWADGEAAKLGMRDIRDDIKASIRLMLS